MIIAGYTSYPWMPDWARFRQIADAVGAYLLADISHIAGMVAAGVVPSPVGHAHVISFTTHKTPVRPARRVHPDDRQGAGRQGRLGRVPGRAGRPARQRDGRHGGRVQAGGQRAVPRAPAPGGRQRTAPGRRASASRPAHPVRRHRYAPAARRHEERARGERRQPGQEEGHAADGRRGRQHPGPGRHRLQSQHHPGRQERAHAIRHPPGHAVDHAARLQGARGRRGWPRSSPACSRRCRPHAIAGRRGPVYSARVDFDVLEEAKRDVVDLACCVDLGADYKPSGYPHHYFMYKPTTDPGGEWDIIEIDGAARPRLLQRRHDATTCMRWVRARASRPGC